MSDNLPCRVTYRKICRLVSNLPHCLLGTSGYLCIDMGRCCVAGLEECAKGWRAARNSAGLEGMTYALRKNLGKLPADFTHKSRQKVWLCCPGCIHECGRNHEWQARIDALTWNGGHIVCPYCACGNGGFCPCRSVANDPRLSREWHPSNPPAHQVAKSSGKKYNWVCPEGHPAYEATCSSRSTHNTGCPVCSVEGTRTTRHPAVSVGRPDLAGEWDYTRNIRSPGEVTLGSGYKAWWVCSNPEHTPWQARVANRALSGKGCPACQIMNRCKPRQFGPAGA